MSKKLAMDEAGLLDLGDFKIPLLSRGRLQGIDRPDL